MENMLGKIPETVPIKLMDLNGVYARGLEELCQQYIAYHRRGKLVTCAGDGKENFRIDRQRWLWNASSTQPGVA